MFLLFVSVVLEQGVSDNISSHLLSYCMCTLDEKLEKIVHQRSSCGHDPFFFLFFFTSNNMKTQGIKQQYFTACSEVF